MKKLKNKRGITLVALIITIIVLLILAVVTISAVNEGNLFAHANNAATRYTAEAELENTKISDWLTKMEQYDNGGTPQVTLKTWAQRGITNLTLDTYYYYVGGSAYYIFRNDPYGSWEENVNGETKVFSAEDIEPAVQTAGMGAYYGYGVDETEQNKTNYFRGGSSIITFDSLTQFTLYTSVSDYENGTNGLVFTISGS